MIVKAGAVMIDFLQKVNQLVWGGPTLILILMVGAYLSIRTGFAQFRLFPKAMKHFLRNCKGKEESGNGVSGRQALCTALAATVGTGNLAGVAGAIAIGGPGAVFWMWISAFNGMILKFAEATLSVRYRTVNRNQEQVGGPMYMITAGLKKKWAWLAYVYCFFGVIAALGVGNATQINTLVGSVNSTITAFGGKTSEYGSVLMGIGLAALTALMLFGGADRIGRVTEKLVPLAAGAYIILCIGVLIVNGRLVPQAFAQIISGAFTPAAVTGGVIGSSFQALRVGVSRGVFTNEAGMGTAGIAHGSADVTHPAEQGLMGIVEVFLDTIVICTLTAMVILCSGVQIPYGVDCGILLTSQAFTSIYGRWVQILITAAICCFAFATLLGWGLYGARCAQFLFGEHAWRHFAALQTITVVIGAVLKTEMVWTFAEIVNGLMAIPSLIAIMFLSPELQRLLSRSRFDSMKSKQLY